MLLKKQICARSYCCLKTILGASGRARQGPDALRDSIVLGEHLEQLLASRRCCMLGFGVHRSEVIVVRCGRGTGGTYGSLDSLCRDDHLLEAREAVFYLLLEANHCLRAEIVSMLQLTAVGMHTL